MENIDRVKSNIQKMINANAPEEDIDSYIASEGLKIEDLQKKVNPLDYASSFISGVNTVVPTLAGLPVDVATNIANLGIAAYGTAKGLAGSKDLPSTLPPQAGGSQWFEEKISNLMGGNPFIPPTQDRASQNLNLAGSVLGAGLVAPSASIKQAGTNIARMIPGAIGAVTGKELFPNQPLAPAFGMMAGLGSAGAAQSIRSKATKPLEAFIKAHRLGYKVPPAQGKRSSLQQVIEGTAGPVPTKQAASIHNQQITNNIIKRDIGYPEDVPLTSEGLNSLRVKAGETYAKVKGFGVIRPDAKFTKALAGISKQGSALSKEFPGLVKKEVTDITNMFHKESFTSEALVDVVKQLRFDANTGFRSSDPGILAVARAKGKIANQIENLIERNAATTAPELVPELKAARQTIAKTYQIENALRGENVDAVALGRLLDKGKPLTGGMKDVAEFGQHFKHSAQINPPQSTNFRPMDFVTGIAPAIATGNAAWLAAAGFRPALRKVILSKPYQNLVAKMPPED